MLDLDNSTTAVLIGFILEKQYILYPTNRKVGNRGYEFSIFRFDIKRTSGVEADPPRAWNLSIVRTSERFPIEPLSLAFASFTLYDINYDRRLN
jgi:hypothetical protein